MRVLLCGRGSCRAFAMIIFFRKGQRNAYSSEANPTGGAAFLSLNRHAASLNIGESQQLSLHRRFVPPMHQVMDSEHAPKLTIVRAAQSHGDIVG